MNKALLAAAGFISVMTALSINAVSDVNAYGQVNGWIAPATILVTLIVATVLGYRAGATSRDLSQLRAQLRGLRDSLNTEPPTHSSTYRLAAHYFDLVNSAKAVLSTAVEKLGK